MQMFGVWCNSEDSFISTDWATYEHAMAALMRLADEDGLDGDDLKVEEMCFEHRYEEQPKYGCEICDEDAESELAA